MMEKITFHSIAEIEFDQEVNQELYQIINSDSEEILLKYPNENIKEYHAKRDEIFPKDLVKLFELLGIDFKKDNEYVFYRIDEDEITEIWFDFIGKLTLFSENASIYYEIGDVTVNVFLREKASYAIREVFKGKSVCRIEVSIVKEK